jgi:hypothetical protein
MPVGAGTTVTAQVAALPPPPSAGVAVIVAVPLDTAVTTPLAVPTEATAGASLDHATVLLLAASGKTVA